MIDNLSGTLYFDVSNFRISPDIGNFAYTLDRSTGELESYQFATFGMMNQPLPNGYSSYYEFSQQQWVGIQNNEGYGIPFADGGYITLINADGQQFKIEDKDGLDFHEFDITPDGNFIWLQTDIRDRYQDSTLTCLPRCQLLGQSIVEVTQDGQLVNEIHLLDFYERSDFVMDDMLIKGDTMLYDVTHANSVQYNADGYLVSVRHTNEVIEFDFDGSVLWRSRDYTIDSVFSHQHDAQILSNGNLLLFDNGNGVRDYSRAVEYQIDHDNKTMNVVWEYSNGHYAPNRGSVQRLSNGHHIINFVDYGIVEIDTDGNEIMRIAMPEHFASYQARLVE